MSDQVIAVTDDTFADEVLKAQIPVLVDFWATWCGPCKMIGPAVEELAREYGDRLKVTKLNVDDNVNTPAQYGIRGIPALLFFKQGELVDHLIGAVPKSQLVKLVDKILGS
jgi:thioredoxin 1